MSTKIINDVDQALVVLQDAGRWLEQSGKNPSKWWKLENLNKDVLLQYAKPEEFYVVLVDDEPAAAAILQTSQDAQDWKSVDENKPQRALYLHWVAVHRKFAGKGYSKRLVDFAKELAMQNDISLIRVDTDFHREKLRKIYEDLGFELVGTLNEGYRTAAFYQKQI